MININNVSKLQEMLKKTHPKIRCVLLVQVFEFQRV